MSVSILYLFQILVSAFLAILFLQSGIDKIVDRRGNLEWLKGHFAKSPLGGFVPLLFAALTIIEVSAGLLSAIGFLALIFLRTPTIALRRVCFCRGDHRAIFWSTNRERVRGRCDSGS